MGHHLLDYIWGESLSVEITSLGGVLSCLSFANIKYTGSYEQTTITTTTVNNTVLERIDKIQHLMSEIVYFKSPTPPARRTCALLQTLPIEVAARGSVID